MRKIIVFIFTIWVSGIFSQKVLPLVDFSGFFKTFQNGFFRQLEFQRIQNYKFGDNVLGYYDNRGNLRVFDGGSPRDLANMQAEYEVSDFLLTWKIGSTLNLWDDGKLLTLSYFANRYRLTDSLVVFEDTRFNAVKVYYNKEIYTLYAGFGELEMPVSVGENILVFKENGDFYKVFWRGKIHEFDVWHDPISFACDIDIAAFNDPINGTFTIFENGEFKDLEPFFVNEYKAGNNFIVYEDQNDNLKLYHNGQGVTLSNFGAEYWDVKDNVVVWIENNALYTFYNGSKQEVVRYKPSDLAIKNEVIAFRNLMGGVSFFYEGKVYEVTTQMNSSYSIHGNSLLVSLFNNSYLVFSGGQTYAH